MGKVELGILTVNSLIIGGVDSSSIPFLKNDGTQ